MHEDVSDIEDIVIDANVLDTEECISITEASDSESDFEYSSFDADENICDVRNVEQEHPLEKNFCPFVLSQFVFQMM